MSLRSTTLAGIAECEIRIRQEHDAFPTAMHAMVTPVPEGESRTLYREKAVRKFARARRCCLSPAFDERLQEPVLAAVKAAGSHRVDFTSLIDVFDTLSVWLRSTRVATTIGEKLHKLHGDLSMLRGRKARDAMGTLSGAVLAQTKQVWERAGFRMQHRMEQPEVAELIKQGRRQAGPSSSARAQAPRSAGSGLIYTLY